MDLSDTAKRAGDCGELPFRLRCAYDEWRMAAIKRWRWNGFVLRRLRPGGRRRACAAAAADNLGTGVGLFRGEGSIGFRVIVAGPAAGLGVPILAGCRRQSSAGSARQQRHSRGATRHGRRLFVLAEDADAAKDFVEPVLSFACGDALN